MNWIVRVGNLVEDSFIIPIKTNNEAPADLQAGYLQFFYCSNHVPLAVVVFGHCFETFLIGRFQSDKNIVKTGMDYQLNHLIVISKVNG